MAVERLVVVVQINYEHENISNNDGFEKYYL